MGYQPATNVGAGFLLSDATVPSSMHRKEFLESFECITNKSTKKILSINSIDEMGNLTGSANTRPFIRVNTQSLEGSWLYDTGASVTCMSLKEFRKIHPDLRPTKIPSDLKLISASKTPMTVTGTYLLDFNIFGKKFKHPVHVCSPMNQRGILGMDIIQNWA